MRRIHAFLECFPCLAIVVGLVVVVVVVARDTDTRGSVFQPSPKRPPQSFFGYYYKQDDALAASHPRGVSRDLQETLQPSRSPSTSNAPSTSSFPTRTLRPTQVPTQAQVATLVPLDTSVPTTSPTTRQPTLFPTFVQTENPTVQPTPSPSATPSALPTTANPTLSPTALPTTFPSAWPTGTPSVSPTQSQIPTNAPTDLPSTLPSGAPTTAPTPIPSSSPSHTPTWLPTIRESELPTQMPSAAPSAVPTPSPSVFPSTAPTVSAQPSRSPTISPQPTVDPYGVDITDGLDDNDNRALTVTCRPDIPQRAQSITTQLIQYDYILNVVNGTSVTDLLPQIEQGISDYLTLVFLDCRYELLRDFYVHQLNSAPNDRIASGCLLEEQEAGATCYAIAGQLTTSFFYLDHDNDDNNNNNNENDSNDSRRTIRQLQIQETQIGDEQVADTFETALSNFFERSDFGSTVVSSSFVGISNRVPPPPPPGENRTPQIVGGVFGALVGAVLLACCVAFVLKRRTEEATNQYYQEAMDVVDSEIDDMDTLAPELQPQRTATIVNEDDDQAFETPMRVMYSGGGADGMDRDVEFIGASEAGGIADTRTTANPDTTPTTERERGRMLEETKRELGPSTYEPKRKRGKDVSDTVDL